jgi:hypothetical protein
LIFKEDEIKINENFSNLLTELDSKIQEIIKEFDEKITKGILFKEEIKEKNIDEDIELKTEGKKGIQISDEDLKMIKDDHKKIHDIDKNLKLYISGSNIDKIKSDIEKLQNEISIKATSTEIDELKDQICK